MSEENYKYFGKSSLKEFWERIKKILDRKIEYVTNKDNSVVVADKNRIAVRISPANGNAIEIKNIPGEQGLFVPEQASVLQHKLTFGSDQDYVFDGSEDVTVPVYQGGYNE